MAPSMPFLLPLLLFVSHYLLLYSGVMVRSATLTISNGCSHPIWPGLLSNAGAPPLPTTGFALRPGKSRSIPVHSAWSGRVWARTHCSSDTSSGRFSCLTGDCGSGKLECAGGGAAPPATLAEFTLSGSGGLDFYDVSLVDGYNAPVAVVPDGREGGKCTLTGCAVDLNAACPAELTVTAGGDGNAGVVACKSACEAFRTAQYCCYGKHGGPDTCKPTAYSGFFKNACPRAYSYAYDDGTSTFTCPAGGNYLISFCPTASSERTASDEPKATLPLTNRTMVYLGGELVNLAAPAALGSSLASLVVAAILVGWKLTVQL